ncbi:MAG: hypothetical protein ACRYHQ_13035, partial [Janthinobacterium lividum]
MIQVARATLPLRTAAALAAWPVAVLLVLAVDGALAWSAALLAAAAMAGGAGILAWVWVRDLGLV